MTRLPGLPNVKWGEVDSRADYKSLGLVLIGLIVYPEGTVFLLTAVTVLLMARMLISNAAAFIHRMWTHRCQDAVFHSFLPMCRAFGRIDRWLHDRRRVAEYHDNQKRFEAISLLTLHACRPLPEELKKITWCLVRQQYNAQTTPLGRNGNILGNIDASVAAEADEYPEPLLLNHGEILPV